MSSFPLENHLTFAGDFLLFIQFAIHIFIHRKSVQAVPILIFFLALAACEMVINARRGIYGLRQTGGGGRWVAQWPLSLKLCWLHSRWLHQQHCSYAPCNHEIISAANLAHFMSQQQQTPPTAKAKTTQ